MSVNELWFTAIVVALAACVVGVTVWRRRPTRAMRDAQSFELLRRSFHRERERVEAKFVELASASGKPRGLRWKDCDFEDGVAYARDRKSGELCAFVAVTVAFEAIEGGGMEEVEAVSNLRAATAVFRHKEHHWSTDGRVIFNLKPVQAIAHFQDSLVLVGEEA
ncbi:MAG: hypothetical protein K8U03_15540 [Planctomycetia bacterium]|nr:hypothetical protein [Planctomycetia bacterium]